MWNWMSKFDKAYMTMATKFNGDGYKAVARVENFDEHNFDKFLKIH